MLSLLVACPGAQVKPQDNLYKAEALYVSQHTDYMSFFDYDAVNDTYTVKATVTEEQKEVLRTRKRVLDDFKVAIDVYRSFVKSGQTPSVEAEQKLYGFIRQFSGGG